MRRGLIALLVAIPFSTLIGFPDQAAAQLQLNTYPGNTVNLARTAVTVANTTTATTLYSFSVPARLFQQFRQPQPGAQALHLKLLGTLTTNPSASGVGNVSIGCNYGGTTASIALVNAVAFTANLSSVPLTLDLWVRQQGTALATPVVQGALQLYRTAGTLDAWGASVVGTTSLNAAQTLTCVWQWASASTTNSLTINHGILVTGE